MRLRTVPKRNVNNSVEKESGSKRENLMDKSYFCGK
jgi:hypothetical protein